MSQQQLIDGARYSDLVDPDDSRFRIITIRVPLPPRMVGAYDGGIDTVTGRRAFNRIERTILGLGASLGVIDHDVAMDAFNELRAQESDQWPCPATLADHRCSRALDHHGDHIRLGEVGDDVVELARWPRG